MLTVDFFCAACLDLGVELCNVNFNIKDFIEKSLFQLGLGIKVEMYQVGFELWVTCVCNAL